MPRETWHAMWAMTRKEVAGFFASPAAFLFLGAFLGVTLFVFFWVETFFSRNLADVRPLFQWMPLLLIFLVAALQALVLMGLEKRLHRRLPPTPPR